MYKIVLLILVLIVFTPSVSANSVCKKNKLNKPHYSLIIDAGSSGSRIYIYHIKPNTTEGLPIIKLISQKKVEPGISTFEMHPDSILTLMGTLLSFAESEIDSAHWKETKLYLMATAGMRLVEKKQQKITIATLTSFFKINSEFNFEKAVILSGQYEGLYAWSALNYLDDSFNPLTARESMLEMGGASTQIAFIAEKSKKDKHVLYRSYGGKSYAIFAKSYLQMGQDRAQELAAVPACYPEGYLLVDDIAGTGDFTECSEEIKRIFNEICDSLDIADSLFKSNFQANTENEFVAIAAFYYTFDFLKFKDTVALDALHSIGENFCDKTWDELKSEYPKENESRLKSYCFNASYFWTLLRQEYGFNKTAVIRTDIEIDSVEISWTLGAVIDLEMGYEPQKHK
ncbi:MAG: Golgi nucleoside diphosphatase [Crocinitomix sp.]|jgi:Golgi nucleoside diphosphatase